MLGNVSTAKLEEVGMQLRRGIEGRAELGPRFPGVAHVTALAG